MKSFYSLLLLFMCLSLTYGQKHTLKTKLTYKEQTENPQPEDDLTILNNYLPEKHTENSVSLFNVSHEVSADIYETFELFTKKKILKVSVNGLDNNLHVGNSYGYSEGVDSIFQDYYFYKIKEVIKTSEKKTILGSSCQYYTLIPTEDASIISLCIDEKNAINNASYFLPNEGIKGLILDIKSQSGYKGEAHFTLTNIEKINIDVNFDYDKELQKLKERIKETEAVAAVEAATAEYNLTPYDDPICSNGYEYFNTGDAYITSPVLEYFVRQYTSTLCNLYTLDDDYDGNNDFDKKTALNFAERNIKSYTKNLRKAKLINKEEAKKLTVILNKIVEDSKKFKLTERAVEYESAYEDSDLYDITTAAEVAGVFAEYESAYKSIDLNDISLAIDAPDLEYLLNSIPKHCTNLKEAIPSFENKELKNLVHNYTGQICDLYLYEIEDSQVDLKGTFERIRKAVLQLENIKEDLNNSDKQKLKTFLNSLD